MLLFYRMRRRRLLRDLLLVLIRRQAEAALLEPFREQAEAGPVPGHELEVVAATVDEDEQIA
jgi:hypothetical protein